MRINKLIKFAFIGIGFCIGLYIICGIVSFFPSGLFDNSSKQELIDNYKKNEREILELKSYFNSIVPTGYTVYIEFNSRNNIDLFVYEIDKKASRFGNSGLFQQWNINPYNYKEPSPDTSEYSPQTSSLEFVKRRLNWDDVTFKTIKKKLDMANCISVSNGEPTEVGYARSGMGKYSYAIFDKPIPETLKQQYNDSCMFILYNQKVALEYGGGAIGSQCFPD